MYTLYRGRNRGPLFSIVSVPFPVPVTVRFKSIIVDAQYDRGSTRPMVFKTMKCYTTSVNNANNKKNHLEDVFFLQSKRCHHAKKCCQIAFRLKQFLGLSGNMCGSPFNTVCARLKLIFMVEFKLGNCVQST